MQLKIPMNQSQKQPTTKMLLVILIQPLPLRALKTPVSSAKADLTQGADHPVVRIVQNFSTKQPV